MDGGVSIGLGHLVRCIALAHMLKDDFSITFFCKEIPEKVQEDMVSLGFNFCRLQSEDSFFCLLTGKETVVLDNYFFKTSYQKKIKQLGCRLVCIDDLCDKEFYADLVINVSPHVKRTDYKAQAYTEFGLGPKYALLRPGFLRKSGDSKTHPDRKKLILSFGGSDSDNRTIETLVFLKDTFDGIINIVVGVSYQYLSELSQYILENDLVSRTHIYSDVNEYELVDLMQDCGVAVCSASSVSIEYLSVSNGLLFLVETATNQNHWYEYAIHAKLAYQLSAKNFAMLAHLQGNLLLQNKLFDAGQKERIIRLFAA